MMSNLKKKNVFLSLFVKKKLKSFLDIFRSEQEWKSKLKLVICYLNSLCCSCLKEIQTYFAFNCLFRMQFIVAIENISIFALSIVTNVNP